VRIRLVLAIGLVLVAGALALELSGTAPRTAGSDHTSPVIFAVTAPGGGAVCQQAPYLPPDAARVKLLIGTFGRPVPELRLAFLDARGREVAEAHRAAGGREGPLLLDLRWLSGAPGRWTAASATVACLHVERAGNIAIGGEGGPPNPQSAMLGTKPQPGRISLIYLRSGEESWWQLLPSLARRFGVGKASLFGTWTLPVIALLLVAVWIATTRLLLRELR
jgi:hypothetical protein